MQKREQLNHNDKYVVLFDFESESLTPTDGKSDERRAESEEFDD
jgi:hypothetical protein